MDTEYDFITPEFMHLLFFKQKNLVIFPLMGITFTSNGSISETTWNALSDGIVTITFYANDSVGNMASERGNVMKDKSQVIHLLFRAP